MKTEYELYRLAIRGQQRANKDLQDYKRTRKAVDLKYYHRHRMRSYYYRKQLAQRLNEKISPKQITQFKTHEKVIKSHELYKKNRKEMRTKFKRVVKYKDDKGETIKTVVTFKFKDDNAIQSFKEQVRDGWIPIPRTEDERRLLVIDDDVETWNLVRLVALYREGS